MTPKQAKKLLDDFGWAPGMTTRGLDPESREKVKAAVNLLAKVGDPYQPPPKKTGKAKEK